MIQFNIGIFIELKVIIFNGGHNGIWHNNSRCQLSVTVVVGTVSGQSYTTKPVYVNYCHTIR